MNAPFSLANVSPAQMLKLRGELEADRGSHIEATAPDHYTIDGHGLTVDAAYDAASETLTVEVVDKPWYVSASMIHDKIVQSLQ